MVITQRRQVELSRKLLRREELPPFLQKKPWIVYVDLALIYIAVIAAFGLMAATDSLAIRVVAFLVIGTRLHALFIMGHDAIHRSLHPNSRINDALANWLIEAPLGVSLDDRRPNHISHHRLLGSDDDPDRKLHTAENKTDALKLLLFVVGLQTVLAYVARLLPLPHKGGGAKRPLREYLAQRARVVAVQLVIAAAIASVLPVWYYPVFWLFAIYALVFVPDQIRGFSEHAHPVLPDAAVDDQRLITFVPTGLEAMFFSPRNMNYHAEHHLWPYVPYYHLPRLHARVRTHPRNTTLVRRSYLMFLCEWFAALPLRSPRRAEPPRMGAVDHVTT